MARSKYCACSCVSQYIFLIPRPQHGGLSYIGYAIPAFTENVITVLQCALFLLYFHSLSHPFSRVSKPPQTLDELGDSLDLWENLNNGKEATEAKFQPLYDQFAIMEKYEVPIPEEISAMLNDLGNEWMVFQQTLIDADVMLKKYKVSMEILILCS